MTTLNTPAIGDEVLDPNEKFDEVDGLTKYDQLLADGSEVDESKHPLYYNKIKELTPVGGDFELTWGGTGDVRGIACSSDGTTVYTVDTTAHALYKSTDSGETFIDVGTNLGNGPNDIACSADGSIVYVVDYLTDALHKSINGGVTFTNMGQMFGTVPVGVACSDDGSIVYVTDTDADAIYTSTNAGVSFILTSRFTGSDPRGVACSGDGSVVYVTDTSLDYVFKSIDSGVTFVNLGQVLSTAPYGVACSSDGVTVYALDLTGFVYVSNNSGDTFDKLSYDFGLPLYLYPACSADGLTLYVSRQTTGVYRAYQSYLVSRPNISSGSDACPYRVVADKYTPSIGEVHPSNLEKYSEDGVAMFDNLLCDGSPVAEVTHPLLYAIMQTLPTNTSTYPNFPDRVIADLTEGV